LEFIFRRVPKRRMANIVAEPGRLGDVLVQPTDFCKCVVRVLLLDVLGQTARDLSNLEGMGHPVVEDVPFPCMDDLRDTCQTPEVRAIENSISIPLKSGSIVT
jgi:hypothetical protein